MNKTQEKTTQAPIATKSLLDRFNSFFGESAEIKINGSNLEVTINHATLIISLPEVVGGYSS